MSNDKSDDEPLDYSVGGRRPNEPPIPVALNPPIPYVQRPAGIPPPFPRLQPRVAQSIATNSPRARQQLRPIGRPRSEQPQPRSDAQSVKLRANISFSGALRLRGRAPYVQPPHRVARSMEVQAPTHIPALEEATQATTSSQSEPASAQSMPQDPNVSPSKKQRTLENQPDKSEHVFEPSMPAIPVPNSAAQGTQFGQSEPGLSNATSFATQVMPNANPVPNFGPATQQETQLFNPPPLMNFPPTSAPTQVLAPYGTPLSTSEQFQYIRGYYPYLQLFVRPESWYSPIIPIGLVPNFNYLASEPSTQEPWPVQPESMATPLTSPVMPILSPYNQIPRRSPQVQPVSMATPLSSPLMPILSPANEQATQRTWHDQSGPVSTMSTSPGNSSKTGTITQQRKESKSTKKENRSTGSSKKTQPSTRISEQNVKHEERRSGAGKNVIGPLPRAASSPGSHQESILRRRNSSDGSHTFSFANALVEANNIIQGSIQTRVRHIKLDGSSRALDTNYSNPGSSQNSAGAGMEFEKPASTSMVPQEQSEALNERSSRPMDDTDFSNPGSSQNSPALPPAVLQERSAEEPTVSQEPMAQQEQPADEPVVQDEEPIMNPGNPHLIIPQRRDSGIEALLQGDIFQSSPE